ncbi:RHS repeat protein, partial [Aquimarina sp. MMG016]|uniref:RHS repeat protein n=1 Tax=Aquimarina sp. MMG016 TaxID=2822690 RepID=UPI001B3A4220
MSNSINKLTVFIVTFVISFMGYSQTEVEYNASQISGAISSSSTLEYIDPNLGTQGSIIDSNTYLSLKVLTDQPPTNWYKYSLKLEVIPMYVSGTFNTEDAYETTLSVEHNMLQGAGNGGVDINTHVLKNISGARVRILEGTYEDVGATTSETNGYTPENVIFTLGYDDEKYTELSLIEPSISNGTAVNNELPINWSEVSGAVSYQLEWTWLDNYGNSFDTSQVPNGILFNDKDFKLNSTRVETKGTSYNIPLIYAKGYIIYRVRAVGRFLADNSNKYRYGKWSSGSTAKRSVADWPHKYLIDQDHENTKNWQFQASYAEDGKKKEVVSYFDGTLRNRQTVTKINSDDNIIVGEVIYDAQGRPAVEVLPVPTNSESIGYYPDFNQNASGEIFSYQDFDLNTQNILDQTTSAKIMSTVNGASKYYSVNNDINDEFKGRVPDAEGHPFSQIEYMPDNTGRIRRKSGVGITHQLGSGQEMEYYYGTPEQKELNRLFGYSVGNFAHYKKNLVIDPNGQASVSYIDPQGRTIATALSGYTPVNLDGLPDEDDNSGLHAELNVDLLGKLSRDAVDTNFDNNIRTATQNYGAQLDALEYAGTKISPFDEGRTFNYSLQNSRVFTYDCDDQNNTVQYPLIYDLSINVLDGDANSLLTSSIDQTINMDTAGGSFVLPEFNVNVSRGSYNITKSLVINSAALESYAADYIRRLQDPTDVCYISPDEVSDLPPLSFEGCFVTCEQCVQALELDYPPSGADTSRDVYAKIQVENYDVASKLPYLTPEEIIIEEARLEDFFKLQWDGLVKACNAPCVDGTVDVIVDDNISDDDIIDNSIGCNIAKDALLNDMKPLGQYGNKDITFVNGQAVEEGETLLSIFNDANQLFSAKASNDLYNSWRNPRHPDYDPLPSSTNELYTQGHYYNDDGTIAYIKVSQIVTTETNDDGEEETIYTYNPPLKDGTEVIEIIDEPGYVYVEPQYLANPTDFVSDDIWQVQWSESLVVYHPEYCYLVYAKAACIPTRSVSLAGNVTMNSDGFDAYLSSIQTYQDAVSKGFLGSFTTLADQDPYFNTSISVEKSGAQNARKALVTEALNDKYSGGDQNLMEFTYSTIACNSISSCTTNFANAAGITSAVNSLNDVIKEDQFWNTYKANYLTMKQTVQSLFANIYAEGEGCYNGCIGPDEAPTTLLTVISDYSGTIRNQINNLITNANDICNDPNKNAYATKEKRFKPSDVLFNSGDSNQDIYEDIREQTNYEYYLETGICPLGRDLELYLEYYFKDYSSGIVASRTYDGTYLSPSLFEDMGGEHPTDIDITVQSAISDNTLQVQFAQNGTVLKENALTITLPSGSGYTWSGYKENTWVITKAKNIYPSYNPLAEVFSYQILVEVRTSSTAETYEEIILTGTTSARISDCSITEANGIGEYIPNDGTIGDQECNRQKRFEAAMTLLMNRLQKDNRINASVVLNNLPEYRDSYLATFFGPGEATWFQEEAGSGVYYIAFRDNNGGSGNKFAMYLEENLNPSRISNITGFNVNYTYNQEGLITSQNVRVSYFDDDLGFKTIPGLLSENCDYSGSGTGGDGGGGPILTATAAFAKSSNLSGPSLSTCRIINFLCCGDINDLVGAEDPVECVKVDSCIGKEADEKRFEELLLEIMKYSFSNVNNFFGEIDVTNQPSVQALLNEFNIKDRLQAEINSKGTNPFTVETDQVIARVSDQDFLDFRLIFGKPRTSNDYWEGTNVIFFGNTGGSNEVVNGNSEGFYGIPNASCLDRLNNGQYVINTSGGSSTFRSGTGSIGTFRIQTRENGVTNSFTSDCEFFDNPEVIACPNQPDTEKLLESLVLDLYNEAFSYSKLNPDQARFEVQNFNSFQNLVAGAFPFKQRAENAYHNYFKDWGSYQGSPRELDLGFAEYESLVTSQYGTYFINLGTKVPTGSSFLLSPYRLSLGLRDTPLDLSDIDKLVSLDFYEVITNPTSSSFKASLSYLNTSGQTVKIPEIFFSINGLAPGASNSYYSFGNCDFLEEPDVTLPPSVIACRDNVQEEELYESLILNAFNSVFRDRQQDDPARNYRVLANAEMEALKNGDDLRRRLNRKFSGSFYVKEFQTSVYRFQKISGVDYLNIGYFNGATDLTTFSGVEREVNQAFLDVIPIFNGLRFKLPDIDAIQEILKVDFQALSNFTITYRNTSNQIVTENHNIAYTPVRYKASSDQRSSGIGGVFNCQFLAPIDQADQEPTLCDSSSGDDKSRFEESLRISLNQLLNNAYPQSPYQFVDDEQINTAFSSVNYESRLQNLIDNGRFGQSYIENFTVNTTYKYYRHFDYIYDYNLLNLNFTGELDQNGLPFNNTSAPFTYMSFYFRNHIPKEILELEIKKGQILKLVYRNEQNQVITSENNYFDILATDPSQNVYNEDKLLVNGNLCKYLLSSSSTSRSRLVSKREVSLLNDLDTNVRIIRGDSEVVDIHNTVNKSSASIAAKSEQSFNCDQQVCIPEPIAPKSCTIEYTAFTTLMGGIANTETGDIPTEEDFCKSSLQYLVSDYDEYIRKFQITSTLDLNYMTIMRFGATELNYGYSDMVSVINAYYTHVSNSPEGEAKTWALFTSDYLNNNPGICPPRPFPVDFGDITVPVPDQTNCEQFTASVREAYTRDTYESFLAIKREEFVKAYIDNAMDNAVETFDMKYFDKEYQYTLYYYDQSGNLVQTVPPEGVDRFSDAELEGTGPGGRGSLNYEINLHRANNIIGENINLLPGHSLKTEYRYNSLNQLVWQKTPDGGITRFAYDDLGRIIASQNAKQLNNNRFSYTTYDGLGRIVEAGEMIPDVGITINDTKGKLVYTSNNTEVPARVEDNFPTNVAANRVEVTRTRYNDLLSDPLAIFKTVSSTKRYKANTRNRVSAIFYYDQYSGSTNGTRERQYNNAIYYAYDIHGNVKELSQHNKQLSQSNTDFNSGMKRVHYEYDLISGNVNKVTYQDGAQDQFIHWYQYDADNRIVSVNTSTDGMIWEQDASYKYFAHGPLARTELGDKKVQGMDYAYTLQGWLKGVNSENLTATTDMGGDGAIGSSTAKDAMGYSLKYYEGDYKPVGTATNTAFGYSANAPTVGRNLYNGNIKQMVTSLLDNDESMLGAQLNQYEYDQLNRIKKMQGNNMSGGVPTPSYNASYTFDNNGNLETLKRSAVNNAGAVVAMDDFTYNYNEDAEGNKISNRLRSVYDDPSLNGNFDTDIDSGQSLDNYTYDEIGQLTKDEAEGITDIQWRVDGKVKSVSKNDGTTISFSYDGLGNRVSKTVTPENKTTVYTRDAQGNVLAVYDTFTDGVVNPETNPFDLAITGETITGTQETKAVSNITVGDINDPVVVENGSVVSFTAGDEITLGPETHLKAGTDAVVEIGEVSGYNQNPEGVFVTEHHIYGSSRLGLEEKNIRIADGNANTDTFANQVGDKRYELSNHLGNVLSVVTDRKLLSTDNSGTFTPDVLAFNDYYPFGMLLN